MSTTEPAGPAPDPSGGRRPQVRRRLGADVPEVGRLPSCCWPSSSGWCPRASTTTAVGPTSRRADPVLDGVNVGVEPVTVDPGKREQTIRMVFLPVGRYADGNDLAQPLQLRLLTAVGGTATVEFKADQPMQPVETRVYLSGDLENYPFDRYESYLVLTITTVPEDDRPASDVPMGLQHGNGVTGWRTLVEGTMTEDGQLILSYQLSRSGSVITFALLLLALMVVLAVLGAVVASRVRTRRAKVEATMASWFGAMIFALVPLRTFLPGAPPVGAWIDILILFWVMVALVVSLAVFIVTWWRTAPAGPPEGARRSS